MKQTVRGQWQSGGRFSPRLTRHLYGKQTQEGRFIFGGDRIPHPTHRPGLIHPLPRCVFISQYLRSKVSS